MNYRQVVSNRANDQNTEGILSTNIYSLQEDTDSSGTDRIDLRIVLSANSRLGIDYAKSGPYAISSYSVNPGAIDTGIKCDDCGQWIDLPSNIPLVFYGVPGMGGTYRHIWVSSNGFISVNNDNVSSPSPALGRGVPNGVIAPFWRDLDPSAGGRIVYYTDNLENFIIWWDQVPTKGGKGQLQSFLVWIHNSSGFQNGQNWIEFQYGSVTPQDGVATAIGIEDQYGVRTSSFSPANLCSASGCMAKKIGVGFKGSNGPFYLNSFALDIAPQTTSGSFDNEASISVDTDVNGVPIVNGLNVNSQLPIDPQSFLPTWAQSILGGADMSLSALGLLFPDVPIIGAAGLLVGGISLTADAYDKLVAHYYNAGSATIKPSDASKSQDAIIQVSTDGFSSDASLAAKLSWKLSDFSKTTTHRLLVRATIGYSNNAYTGANMFSITTTNQLDLIPAHQWKQWSFDSGTLEGWNAYNANPQTVTDYWGVSSCTSHCFTTPYNVWTTGINDGTGAGKYYNNMDDRLSIDLPTFVGYTQLTLYFHAWIDTQTDVDKLYLDYYNSGSWQTAAVYSGPISTFAPRSSAASTQWMSPKVTLPATTTGIRFRFITDGQGVAEGVYLDDVVLFADGASTSYDVNVSGQLSDGRILSPLAAPVSLDSAGRLNTPVVYLAAGGSHTITTDPLFQPIGSTAGYQFVSWDNGLINPTRDVTLQTNQNYQATYQVFDYTLSASPSSIAIADGRSGSVTIVANSINQFNLTVSISIISGIPSCVSYNFSKQALQLTPEGSDSATLTMSASSACPASSAPVTIQGTGVTAPGWNGLSQTLWFTHQTSFVLNLSEFQVAAAPTPVGIKQGASGPITVTVTSLNNHPASTISLLTSGLPSCATAAYNPNPLSLPSGSASVSTLTISPGNSCLSGSYTLTIQGSDGTISRSTPVTLTIGSFTLSASPSPTDGFTGTSALTSVIISPYYGVTDTLALSVSGLPSCVSYTFNPATINLPAGGFSTLNMNVGAGCSAGTFTVTVSAAGSATSQTTTFTLRIIVTSGGFGSVAAGTLITLADGSKIPVQNLQVGTRLLSYDMTSQEYVVSTITKFSTVVTHDQMIIHTSTGKPLVVDQNPAQKLYVRLPDETWTLMSVTDLKPGYSLFDASTRTWVAITAIQLENSGVHIMYDIFTTAPGNYIANNYLDPIKE